MMQSCNGQQNGGSHVIRVGRWCIVFLPGTVVGLRVERLLTRNLLGTRLDARPTCLLLNLMGGQDGPVCDV